jgi:hypothetical protein
MAAVAVILGSAFSHSATLGGVDLEPLEIYTIYGTVNIWKFPRKDIEGKLPN